MSRTKTRWVLAFDGNCAQCRRIADVVAKAGSGKLDILPLTHPDVQSWRTARFGAEPPWTPTLFAIEAARIRAWTGPAMTMPLLCRLGPRSTTRILSAVGRLQLNESDALPESTSRGTVGRKQFLRLGAGAAAAMGLVLAGRTPSFAAGSSIEARNWVEQNKARLPQSYDDVVAQPTAYRREIFKASSPQVRSQLWVEHLGRYRTGHPGLTRRQTTVVEQVLATASDTANFTENHPDRAAIIRKFHDLGEAVNKAFSREEALAMVGTLGPLDSYSTRVSNDKEIPAVPPGCKCNVLDSYCWDTPCVPGGCIIIEVGCGVLYCCTCNGLCS